MLDALYKTNQSWKDFPLFVQKLIDTIDSNGTIVEVGAGANPSLSKEQVGERKYILIDVSQSELNKSEGDYFNTMCIDVSKGVPEIKADLVISRMLLEHIPNPKEFHRGVHKLLKNKGKAIHFYATLYSPASIINLFLPESISKPLLYKIQNRKWEKEGKFPAFYRWTLGPTKKQINRLENCGFKFLEFNGYIGQGYFYGISILGVIEKLWNKLIWKIRSPYLCSNAIMILQKKTVNHN